MSGIPIRGAAKGSAGAAFTIAKRRGAQRLDFTRDYFVSLYAVCTTLGVNADVLVAQWSEETGDGTSAYWLNDGNPAGIAAFDDGSNWGLTFTPETAAGGQAVHMCRYLGMSVSPDLQKLDARWQAVADAGYVGKVKTTADLGNGLWATNPAYAKNLVERYTAYWGEYTDASSVPTTPHEETPVSDTADKIIDIIKDVVPGKVAQTITHGKVPFPGYYDRQGITAGKREGVGWNNLGKRTPRFMVIHRMVGALAGTDSWFSSPDVPSLTDYGIGTANVDGPNLDGVIYQWNNPRGYRAGWASGPVSAPYGDALRWLQWGYQHGYDANLCNICGVSMEDSGQYNDPMTDFSIGELAQWAAYWFDQFGIDWDKAPIHPETGISAITWHQEWTKGTGKICPGPWLMERTEKIIELAKVTMKKYQLSGQAVPAPTPEPAPKPGTTTTPPAPVDVPEPTWMPPVPINELIPFGEGDIDKAKAVVSLEGGDFVWVHDRVRALRTTKRLRYAYEGSKVVGPDIKAGEEFDVLWLFTAKDGNQYYYTGYHTRIKAEDTERVKD